MAVPRWIKDLDELLRGDRTRTATLGDGAAALPMRVFVPLAVGLGAAYGFFMGWYALAERAGDAGGLRPGLMQLVASTVKLPALFLLTLAVTFPSLYVFNALVGYRMSFTAALRLLVAAIVVNLAVAASLGPILAFFTLSTTSYHFMVVLNVALLGLAGAVGLGFLRRTLRSQASWDEASVRPTAPPAPEPEPVTPADLAARRRNAAERAFEAPARAAPEGQEAADIIFPVWVVIYSLVGAQMGWLLRPFIGRPDLPFEWFRAREGNFFLALLGHLRELFGV